MNRKIKILVRFDDICPTMNYALFKKAVSLMEQYHVYPLLGIIPDCKDPDLQIEPYHEDFWEYIKGLHERGYKIAMHGYQHVFDIRHHGIVENRMGSEFAGHPYEIQYEKLKKGKELLLSKGIKTDIFFAPAHSYDENTIKALSNLGFKYISDGKSNKPYKRFGVLLLPCRSGGCPKIRGGGMYTAVFHAHEWIRPDKSYDYDNFIQLLSEHSQNIVSFDDYSTVNPSNTHIQQIVERFYVFYSYNVRPTLVRLFHIIKKVKR